MVSIKELTDELNTHCVKIGIDIVGFGDSIHFNKFNAQFQKKKSNL